MKTILNSLIVVTGMSAAFVAGFWAYDKVYFYKDMCKTYRDGNMYRSPYTTYSDLNDRMKKEYDRGYKTGYTDGWNDCKDAYGDEEKNEDI